MFLLRTETDEYLKKINNNREFLSKLGSYILFTYDICKCDITTCDQILLLSSLKSNIEFISIIINVDGTVDLNKIQSYTDICSSLDMALMHRYTI